MAMNSALFWHSNFIKLFNDFIARHPDAPQGGMDREHDAFKQPTDDREKLFLETALSLFRAQPIEARDLMLNLLRQRLHEPASTTSASGDTNFAALAA